MQGSIIITGLCWRLQWKIKVFIFEQTLILFFSIIYEMNVYEVLLWSKFIVIYCHVSPLRMCVCVCMLMHTCMYTCCVVKHKKIFTIVNLHILNRIFFLHQVTHIEDSTFSVFAPNQAAMNEAKDLIDHFLTTEREPDLEFGAIYTAKIVEVRDIGVMVTLYSNMTPALLHNSQLDQRKVREKLHYISHLSFQLSNLSFLQYFIKSLGLQRLMCLYVGKSISKLQIQVSDLRFWIKCGKLSPLDGSTIKLYCDAQRSVCAWLKHSGCYKMAASLSLFAAIAWRCAVFVGKRYGSKGYPQLNAACVRWTLPVTSNSWVQKFSERRTSIEDEYRVGRPV